MYEVIEPILGFNEYDEVEINPFDRFFSTLTFDSDETVSMSLANAKHLKNINFTLEDDVVERLELDDETTFDIYFTMVVQSPSEESIINLGAPIIVNEDKKTVGQFVSDNNELFTMCKIKDLNEQFKE